MRSGPRVSVVLSCSGCEHVRTTRYAVQGDSGCDVSCAHPSASPHARVGDTTWATPAWCPLRAQAVAAVSEVADAVRRAFEKAAQVLTGHGQYGLAVIMTNLAAKHGGEGAAEPKKRWYLPMDCPGCARRRLEYFTNESGDAVSVKCEKCMWTSDDVAPAPPAGKEGE